MRAFSPAELAAMRGAQAGAMMDTCTLRILSVTVDDYGQEVETFAERAGVACGLDVTGGAADIQQAPDIAQVRALGRVAALRVAQMAAASWYDFSADGGDYKRSQVQKQIGEALKNAERDAMLYDQVYAVGTGVMRQADPYDWDAEDQAAAGVG